VRAVRHQLKDDGTVKFIVVGAAHGKPGEMVVSMRPSDAKVLAWGILSDLDPEESEKVIADRQARERKQLALTDRALLAIARGAESLRDICVASELSEAAASAHLKHLRENGFAVNSQPRRGRGNSAKYSLTAAGERRAAQLEGASI
jgi:biotin operon repressor